MLSSLFQSALGRETLVAADDTWALLFVLVVSVGIAIYLEQKYDWASKISGAIIALIFALVLSNLAIIPTSCVLYDDIIWGYAVPMGIPLLLLQCNMKRIWKETGRVMVIFLIGAVGTVCGAFIAYGLLHNVVPEAAGVAAMMTGSYIGGGVNFAALAGQFEISGETVGATTVADNLLMALYFFVLIFIAGTNFFRSRFPHPHIDAVEAQEIDESKTQAAAYWGRKDISLKDIAINIAYSVVIVFLAQLIASGIAAVIPTSNPVLEICNVFFGSQYVWITTLSMIVATFGEKQVEKLNGSQEIGTYFIYLFLFVIGVPASIVKIITETPSLLLFTAIMVLVNMVFCFVAGKLLRFDLEDSILASNANIGGPTTAAGMAISQGWSQLVGPIMLVGTFGYVVGTYLGVVVGGILGA
ncbi:DUF819 domain-containing protein [Eubacterium sp. AB3007]|uniref:DUF819 family protein n=1 Tax=Eubacterium sp. AB3007 TaxID=1392487 RepID=UPI00068B970A|nr:DUF819 family protein [Eubacterium sp. AB3007]